jgi:hypothetical protein
MTLRVQFTLVLLIIFTAWIALVGCGEWPQERRQRCAADPNPNAYDCEKER